MTHEEIQQNRRTYDDAFIARCKDLAVIGLQPSQIAERLGLLGTDRAMFLSDCCCETHPLHQLIFQAYKHGEDDLDAALITTAVGGDTAALELAYKVKDANDYNELKKQLFGI